MSNSIQKNYAKMHRAKSALTTLAKYSQTCSTPQELAELGNLLLDSIYQVADKKDAKPLKSMFALALLDDALGKRKIKAKYSKVPEISLHKQKKIMLDQHNKGLSYQKIADHMLDNYGVKVSKSKVYQTIKGLKNEL